MTLAEYASEHMKVLEQLHGESAQQWELAFSGPHSDTEHVENFTSTIAQTRTFFKELQEEQTKLFFISTKDTSLVIAQVGNSPYAELRARYIAMCQPLVMKAILQFVIDNEPIIRSTEST